MGMLMAMTLLKQKEEAEKAAKEKAEVKEEIPFTEPEEPEQREVPKTTVSRGRRKGTK